jgi:hypothetical protein
VRWSLDFVADQFIGGRRMRILVDAHATSFDPAGGTQAAPRPGTGVCAPGGLYRLP